MKLAHPPQTLPNGVIEPAHTVEAVCAACGYDLDAAELEADACADCGQPLNLKQRIFCSPERCDWTIASTLDFPAPQSPCRPMLIGEVPALLIRATTDFAIGSYWSKSTAVSLSLKYITEN